MPTRDHMSEVVAEILATSDQPLTTKQIVRKAFGSISQKNIERMGADLGDLLARGKVFEFPPERSGYGTRFGLVKPSDWLAERLLTVVQEAGGRLTLGQVGQGLRKWERPLFDEALGKLVNERKLFYLTVRFKYVLAYEPDPYDYLLPRQVTALKEILERINRHRKNALTIEEVRALLNDSTVTETSPIETSRSLSEDLLREWYTKDLPRRGGPSSIPITWTWSHYESWCRSRKVEPDLGEFQDFFWSLAREGKIEFISHSLTQSIPERESEISLRGHHGEVLYYWKMR